MVIQGFSGGSDGKESACSVGDLGSIPRVGRSTGEGTGNSSILSWKIPWREEPEGLQPVGLQRVGHDWVTNTFTFIQSLRKFSSTKPALTCRTYEMCTPKIVYSPIPTSNFSMENIDKEELFDRKCQATAQDRINGHLLKSRSRVFKGLINRICLFPWPMFVEYSFFFPYPHRGVLFDHSFYSFNRSMRNYWWL